MVLVNATAMSMAIGLLGGIAASVSLPPFGLWPLGPLGIVMLLLATEDHHLGSRALTGFAFGLGVFVPGLWWAQHFNWYGASVLMAVESAFFLVAAMVMSPGRGRTLTAIGALTLAELLRCHLPFGGLPIGGLPLGQVDGPLVDIARTAGPFGLMMAIVVAGAGLRVLMTALAARGDHSGDAIRRAVLGGGLLGLVVLAAALSALAPNGGPSVGTRTAAAVQGGGPRGTSAQQTDPTTVTNAQLAALSSVPVGTQLTVLPEDVIGLNGPLAGSWQLAALSSAAQAKATTLLAGVTSPIPQKQFLNYVVALDASGTIIGRVEKVHRVPFGEYVPGRDIFRSMADLSGVPRDAVAGTSNEVLHTPAGTIGVLISFEVFFADRGAGAVANGAQLLVVPTNTTSYPSEQMPAQELAAARLQAIEHGRDIVQASPTGYSAMINNLGSVTMRSSLSARTALISNVSLHDGRTLYDRTGDLAVLILALLCIAAGQFRARQSVHPSS